MQCLKVAPNLYKKDEVIQLLTADRGELSKTHSTG